MTASRHALPTTRGSLDELADLLRAFRNTADAWLADRDRWHTAVGRADDAEAAAARSRQIAQEATAAAEVEAEHADGLAVRLSAVEAGVDVSYRQVVDEINALRDQRRLLIEWESAGVSCDALSSRSAPSSLANDHRPGRGPTPD